jgi:hypothetical protein
MIKNKENQSKTTLDKLLKEANKVNVKELMSNSLFTDNKQKKNKTTKSKKVFHKKNKQTKNKNN